MAYIYIFFKIGSCSSVFSKNEMAMTFVMRFFQPPSVVEIIVFFSIKMTTVCLKVIVTDPRNIAGDDHGIYTIVTHDDPGSEESQRARRTFNTADTLLKFLNSPGRSLTAAPYMLNLYIISRLSDPCGMLPISAALTKFVHKFLNLFKYIAKGVSSHSLPSSQTYRVKRKPKYIKKIILKKKNGRIKAIFGKIINQSIYVGCSQFSVRGG